MSGRRAVRAADRRGWVAFTVPPVAWMGQLLLLYLLVPVACERGRGPLLVVTVAALAATVAAIVAGRAPRHRRPRTAPHGDIAGVARIQGGVFAFAIVLTGAAALWIDPCA